jgi:DNA repair protein RadC
MQTLKSKSTLFELRKIQSDFQNVKISRSEDAAKYVKQFYFDDLEIFESAFIVLLNQANNTIGYAKISQGGITGTVIDTRIVAHYAVNSLATGVIVVHNHPSGNLKPSEQDLRFTKKLKEGLSILDIALLDSLILTSEGYTSLNDEGKM